MPYNSNIHNRRSIRLKGYDYSQAGLYFITICVQGRNCLLGEIVDGAMILNDAGRMVEKWYRELENKFPDKKCHEMVVMPNHFHCIIENVATVGADLRVCPDDANKPSILGEPLSGDSSLGDSLSGDSLLGDSLSGDSLSGDSLSGDSLLGDSLSGDSLLGEPLLGEPLSGDSLLGEPLSGDSSLGDSLSGDSLSGDSLSGDSLLGEPLLGEPLSGEPLLGEPLSGEPLLGDSLSGEPLLGDSLLGEPLLGDSLSGEPLFGEPLLGEPLSGEHAGSPLHRAVQWFKTMSTNEYIRGVKQLGWQPFNGKLWQRNYWEHIIRDGQSYQRISEYIINNPKNWENDKLIGN